MENVRYRVAPTTRKTKTSSYDTPAAVVNAAASSRQAPAGGDYENYHPGRRHRSRRRDVYAAPDEPVRVSTLSPPSAAVADAVRRRVVDCSDVHAKSPPAFWAQPTFSVSGSGTSARSRSRPRPPLGLELAVQRRGDISGDYLSVESRRFQEQQLIEESQHRQRRHQHQQQQQHHAASLNTSVEFAARCAVDCRPQVNPSPTSLLPGQTLTSPTPAATSPSYSTDNKTLLKEALISAAAAKLARSSSARSALVRPLVVIRNGPAKSSSDEHVDADDDDDDDVTTTVKPPLSDHGPKSSAAAEPSELTADVTIAAAAAAATRRSRAHRHRDADQVTTNSGVTTSSAVSGTSQGVSAETRRTRPVNSDTAATTTAAAAAASDRVSQSGASSVTGTKAQDAAGLRRSKPAVDAGGSPTAASQTVPPSNCDQVDESRRPGTSLSTAGSTHVTETKTKKTRCTADDNRKDSRPSTSDTPRRDVDVADKTISEPEITPVVADAGTNKEPEIPTSKVAFIKSILTRTRSPSPGRYRRSRSKSKAQRTSPSPPSSVKRIGSEMAQRIGVPVKGYLKQLRDRSNQRRRSTERGAAGTTKTSGELSQDPHELAAGVTTDNQPTPSEDPCPSAGVATSCDDRSSDDVSSRGSRCKTDRKKPGKETSALTTQWKSASELMTPMSRLDNLLKANSLQHLQTSTSAAVQGSGASTESSGTRAVSSTSMSSSPALLSKSSQSAGCLLSSADRGLTPHHEAAMSRCYLEKPPRAARRSMTVQLDRRAVDRQASSAGLGQRQSTSQADLHNPHSAGSCRCHTWL